uniref:Uncharacterized protein n=1 Tax=Cacopsylla melanoneura TaxID=428564 RepID=A0A8D8LW53_9HEMI
MKNYLGIVFRFKVTSPNGALVPGNVIKRCIGDNLTTSQPHDTHISQPDMIQLVALGYHKQFWCQRTGHKQYLVNWFRAQLKLFTRVFEVELKNSLTELPA